ncbi:MAG: RrF2 family transcriptional regulator [Longibaculum sp.]
MSSEFIIAIHVLAYLRKENKQLSSEELANNVCVNPVRVRKVLSQLKKAGIVKTKVGVNGGYYAEIGSEQITLKEVYDAIHTKICQTSWRSGDINKDCMVSSGMSHVVDNLCNDLEKLCQNYFSTLTIKDILMQLEYIFEEGK